MAESIACFPVTLGTPGSARRGNVAYAGRAVSPQPRRPLAAKTARSSYRRLTLRCENAGEERSDTHDRLCWQSC